VRFSLLPAIDLTHGRLGVITPDGPVPLEAYGGDALAAATAFRDAGARWLHVVDMDLAFTGVAGGLDTVRAIASLEGVRIQASGGVRTAADVELFRAAGAARVVLSSGALGAEREVVSLLAKGNPDELVVGIEVADGRIRSRGVDPVDLDLMSTLGWLRAAGARALLVTAVRRVGTGAGPDLDLIRRVARRGVATFAAGGVTSLEELRSVREAGAVGAVIGRAAVDGRLDLHEALAWAAI
jgi:phosphoribosylformimino-5-aminoimidazole carboxamide ribonucleotide (ProFAR) isomerase